MAKQQIEEFICNGREGDECHAQCHACGANVEFDPETQSLNCEFCGATKKVEAIRSQELDIMKLFAVESGNNWANDAHVFECEGCGAREVLDKSEMSSSCAFCGKTAVVNTQHIPGIRPNAIVPFRLNKEAALKCLCTWSKKKFYAPGKFKKMKLRDEELQGVYTPAFSFDTFTRSFYRGRIGQYYWVTVRINGKMVSQRRTRWMNISGGFNANFNEVLIHATEDISKKDSNKLAPFDTGNSVQYEKNFLRGFAANHYKKDGKQCWAEARTYIEQRLRQMILRRYTHDVVDFFQAQTAYEDIKFKYVLLPVYVGHHHYKKKNYNFFVNGANGKTVGRYPKSVPKILATIGIGLLAVGGIITGIGFALGLF
ncbi:MAG: hypothetical protein FWE22_00560 [Firmicutes bacterium]|nr:hypothetical protein [Bacillota bacterium]